MTVSNAKGGVVGPITGQASSLCFASISFIFVQTDITKKDLLGQQIHVDIRRNWKFNDSFVVDIGNKPLLSIH